MQSNSGSLSSDIAELMINKGQLQESIDAGLANGADGITPGIQSTLTKMADQIRGSIVQTLGNAIYEGFKSAFSGKGIGGLLKGFGKTLMGGLGQIISDQGMLYLEYSGIMQAFTPLLGNPFTAGFAGAAPRSRTSSSRDERRGPGALRSAERANQLSR
jgi:hypothetical protein